MDISRMRRRRSRRRAEAHIFISYRRKSAGSHARSLYQSLENRFGKDRLFMDVSNVPFGQDFRSVVQETIASSKAMLVVIEPNWAGRDGRSFSRLHDADDHVRVEIEGALACGVAVFPVLVGGAVMPHASMLPASIEEVAFRNAAILDHESWDDDVGQLAAALSGHFQDLEDQATNHGHDVESPPEAAPTRTTESSRSKVPRLLAAVAGTSLVAALAFSFITGDNTKGNSSAENLGGPSISLRTAVRPTEVMFTTMGGSVALSWNHPGGDDVTYLIQDEATGNEIAAEVTATSYVFPAPVVPPVGGCVRVAAVETIDGPFNPIAYSDPVCR